MEPTTFAITATAWLWDKYGETVMGKTADTAKVHWDKFRWKTAAEKYREKIIKLYDSMQIMGMAKPVSLDDIFTEAYMLDKPTAFGRFDIEHLKKKSADPDAPPDAERINGLRLVKEKGNLFILGKPGAGKTTFLKYIAVKAAEQLIDKVPIFVSLKHWADSGLELMPFIEKRFDICGFPVAQPFVEELLKSGNAIVLFDGLDEVNQEGGQRDKRTRWMKEFIEQYDQTQCLITCRIAASDYTFEPFTYVEIADFTEAQIKIFVGNWFRNKEGEKDEETRDKFLMEFAREDNKGLRDLARTPLLLTLLCLAFNETLTFPQRRVEIYQEALDALLKKWDSSRRIKRDEVYRTLSLGHKENMLARISAETFEKNEYFIPQPELERRITDYVKNVPPHDTNEATDGEAILKAIEAQHGIFVERAHKVYSFSHLTFQEYFTAKYIVANVAKGTLASLVKVHCTDARWREVFLLTTSLLQDASQFVTIIRRNMDELLRGDENLRDLLAWGAEKSSSIQTDPWVARLSYLFAGLRYSKQAPNPTLDHIVTTIAVTLINSLVKNQRNLQQRSLALPDTSSDPSEISEIEFDFGLSDAVINVDNFERSINRARKLGLNEFAEALNTLTFPTDKASAIERQEFANKLRSLMIKHRNIGYAWDLTEIQQERLIEYINATRLLQDCLELAYMPPDEKEAILNSLYLPPSQAGDVQEAKSGW
ncbi:MAG TPA: NACHT domain-containing protein [Pyrinomonadaceae bacterium]